MALCQPVLMKLRIQFIYELGSFFDFDFEFNLNSINKILPVHVTIRGS